MRKSVTFCVVVSFVSRAVDVWVIKMDWLKKQASKTSLSKKKSYNEKTLLHGHLEIDVKQYANY